MVYTDLLKPGFKAILMERLSDERINRESLVMNDSEEPIPGWLALDFDGVVWDSVGECYQMALLTWEQMGLSPKPSSASSGPDATILDPLEIRFRAGRHLCRTAHDFHVLLDILVENPTLDPGLTDLESFARARVRTREVADRFDSLFYPLRDDYRNHDFETWLSWQKPMQGVPAAIRRLKARLNGLSITTTKDEPSVRRILKTLDLDLDVIGKETTRDKGEQILIFAQQSGTTPDRVILLDDVGENLEMAREVGAGAALACWGYNTSRERDRARAAGYSLVGQSTLESDLKEAFQTL